MLPGPLGQVDEESSFRQEVKWAFLAVCDLGPAVQRKRLVELCDGDERLLREVERLLNHDVEDTLFDEVAPAAADGLIGRTIGNYKLLERIGEGGMGVVYRAEDVRLKRQVAVKFLSAQLIGDARQQERFLREAQAAASIDHPSVGAVHDIGTAEGRPYIVSAFIPGGTLAHAIEGRGLSLHSAIEYTIQIADGLQTAHAHGVLHRDLKPSNVILTTESDGSQRAKIIDFGLARVTWGNQLTETGRLIGTANYICPEILKGQRVDQRSDVWSLGVMLYEMLTGHPPFDTDNRERLFYKICNENPAPIRSVNPSLPPEAERVIAKALERDVERRYQDMGSLASDLRLLQRQIPAADEPLRPRTWIRPAAVSPVPGPVRVLHPGWILTAIAAVALLPACWFLWLRSQDSRPSPAFSRIAVLPFEDLSLDKRDGGVSRVIEGSLASRLAGISSVRVVSGAAVRGLEERHASLSEIVKQLHADYLVTGAVTRAGDAMRVTTNLISSGDESIVWSKELDFKWKDQLTFQSEFGDAVLRQMGPKLAGGLNPAVVPTTNADAYDAYLKARFNLIQFSNAGRDESLQAAERRLKRALAFDPGFIDAMTGLAEVRLVQLSASHGNRDDLIADATQWLNRALSKDKNNPSANSLMGEVYEQRGKSLAGLPYARGAVENAPKDGMTHFRLGRLYSALGFFESAMSENEKAVAADMSAVTALYAGSWYLFTTGRFAEAEAAGRNLLAQDSRGPSFPMAQADLEIRRGNYRKATEISAANARYDSGEYGENFEIANALARSAEGDSAIGRAVLKKYAASGIDSSDDLILLAAAVGDADLMVKLTRESPHFNNYAWVVRSPFMEKVAGKEPFRQLLFDLYKTWGANLAELAPSLPVAPPPMPEPEVFLASRRSH